MFVIPGIADIEIIVEGSLDGQQIINRMDYLANPGTIGESNSTDFLAAIAALWATNILPLVCDDYTLLKVSAKRLESIAAIAGPPVRFVRTFTTEFDELAVDTPGDLDEPCLPSYVAVTGRKRTGFRGRGNYGSIRIAGVPEADTIAAGNTLTALAIGTWAAGLSALQEPIGLPTIGEFAMVPCVINSSFAVFAGGGIGAIATSSSPITTIIPNTYVGSQLSRKRKAAA